MSISNKQLNFINKFRPEIIKKYIELCKPNEHLEFYVNEDCTDFQHEIKTVKGTFRKGLDLTKLYKENEDFVKIPLYYKILWIDTKTSHKVIDCYYHSKTQIN